MQPTVTVELDVVEAEVRRVGFEGIFLVEVAQFGEIGVAEQAVVIEVHLGVERDGAVIFGDDEGVDFQEVGVGGLVGLRERDHGVDNAFHGLAFNAHPERQPPRLVGHQADTGLDDLFEDQLRRLGGDLFDIHAALGRGHQNGPFALAVEDDTEVEFAVDRQRFLDENALDEPSFGAGLVGDEGHPDDLIGELGGLVGVVGQLDAAAFAAPARVDLRFDNDAATELLSSLAGFVGSEGDFASGNGDVVLAQNALCLILVNFHAVNRRVIGFRGELRGKAEAPHHKRSIPGSANLRMSVREALHKVVRREALSEDEAVSVMGEILAGESSPALIGSLLTGLAMKGETVDEIVGFARAMRAAATPVPCETPGSVLVDTCGTGGDGSQTFNISTVSAFVVAGAGVAVAKHGNRSISSRCGSADVLEAAGVNVALTPERMGQSIDEVGIGFLFAPTIHTAMKHAGPVRAELKMRTVFNLLGPLTNPAGAAAQVIGVFDGERVPQIAEALARLGVSRAFVVHGHDGLDEITTTGPTRVAEVRDGEVTELRSWS